MSRKRRSEESENEFKKQETSNSQIFLKDSQMYCYACHTLHSQTWQCHICTMSHCQSHILKCPICQMNVCSYHAEKCKQCLVYCCNNCTLYIGHHPSCYINVTEPYE